MKWLLLLHLACLAPLAQAQGEMELHLVMAIDVSASVNDVEFDLQRTGTAIAFRDSAVAGAIEAAPGGVAVAIVQWSSVSRQALGLDWVTLRTRAEATAYADRVAAMPRRLPGGGTMIHAGLDFAAAMFETAPGSARRRVIDLAGNGRTDDMTLLRAARRQLALEGITVNALAIEELKTNLTDYFEEHVIVGPHAFVITADEFEDVKTAMQIKLLREICGTVIGQGHLPHDRPAHTHPPMSEKERDARQAGIPPSLSSPASSIRRSKSGTVTWRLPSSSITPSLRRAEIWRLTVSSVRPR